MVLGVLRVVPVETRSREGVVDRAALRSRPLAVGLPTLFGDLDRALEVAATDAGVGVGVDEAGLLEEAAVLIDQQPSSLDGDVGVVAQLDLLSDQDRRNFEEHTVEGDGGVLVNLTGGLVEEEVLEVYRGIEGYDVMSFGQPEIQVGVFPPVAAQIMPRIMGRKAAMDLILSGRIISAQEALQMGLVNKVVKEEELKSETTQFLKPYLKLSAEVLRKTKKAVTAGLMDDFDPSLKIIEEIYLNELMKTTDANEGLKAFIEKRKPEFWQFRKK